MTDVASRLGRIREATQGLLQRARGAAPRAVPWIAGAVGAAVALAAAVAIVLVSARAGEEISRAFMGSTPLLGRTLGYLLTGVLLAAGVALFFVALAALVRSAAWALSAVASAPPSQSERYVIAGLIALLPAAAAYVVATQDAFQALPLELKQHLVPVLLPFAVGAAAAPAWGRRPALTLTVISLLAVGAIVAAAGYLSPAAAGEVARAPDPLAAVWHWAELMRQSSAIQRLWWMLIVLLAAMIWSIAVFAGFRERET